MADSAYSMSDIIFVVLIKNIMIIIIIIKRMQPLDLILELYCFGCVYINEV